MKRSRREPPFWHCAPLCPSRSSDRRGAGCRADASRPKAVAAEPIKDIGRSREGRKDHPRLRDPATRATAPLEITEVRAGLRLHRRRLRQDDRSRRRPARCTSSSTRTHFRRSHRQGRHGLHQRRRQSADRAHGASAACSHHQVKPGLRALHHRPGRGEEGHDRADPLGLRRRADGHRQGRLALSLPEGLLPRGQAGRAAAGRQGQAVAGRDDARPRRSGRRPGRFRARHHRSSKQKMVEIPVSGFVRPAIAVTPPIGRLRPDRAQGALAACPHRARLLDRADQGDRRREQPQGHRRAARGVQEGREYQIRVTLKPEIGKGPINGKLSHPHRQPEDAGAGGGRSRAP